MDSIRVAKDPDEAILSTIHIDEFSSPYYVNKASTCRSCKFDICRGVTYILAFLIGLVIWMKELVVVGCGFRSTYAIPTDEEFAKLFETPFPYGVWTKRTTTLSSSMGSSSAQREEDILELSTEDITVAENDILPGTYIKPVKMIFKRSASYQRNAIAGAHDLPQPSNSGQWSLCSVEVDNELLLKERDGNSDAWHMTKLFALHAIHYFILMKRHPFTHFQQEKMIAATTYLFPNPDHEMRKLLDPHCAFTSDINYGVLETKKSPLFAEDSSWCCWNAHTFNRAGNQKLIGRGYEIASSEINRFGDVPTPELQPHYNSILKLTSAVVTSMLQRIQSITNNQARELEFSNIIAWLGFMKRHLYYPVDLNQPASINHQLAALLADNIFDVSVRHSTEHHFMSRSDQRIHRMFIVKPWSRDIQLPHTTNSPCCAWRCGLGSNSSGSVAPMLPWLKQLMYNSLFAEWTNNRIYNDGRLHKTDHHFATPELQRADAEFRSEIAAIPDTFIPKNRLARSVEW